MAPYFIATTVPAKVCSFPADGTHFLHGTAAGPILLYCLPLVALMPIVLDVGKRNRDAIVMDAPIWYHTPKLILWSVFEALDLFLAIWITRK